MCPRAPKTMHFVLSHVCRKDEPWLKLIKRLLAIHILIIVYHGDT
uniref:Uncharacterized protein n=1 Tax=Schistosoma mansoni TaxID=6183 RepID=A0A913KWJ7_SCHMA